MKSPQVDRQIGLSGSGVVFQFYITEGRKIYIYNTVEGFKRRILRIINWQPLCAGQYGKCGILIGSEALTTGSLQTGIDIHSITTMLAASAINENKCE